MYMDTHTHTQTRAINRCIQPKNPTVTKYGFHRANLNDSMDPNIAILIGTNCENEIGAVSGNRVPSSSDSPFANVQQSHTTHAVWLYIYRYCGGYLLYIYIYIDCGVAFL